jgi:uncharacterized membrane protein
MMQQENVTPLTATSAASNGPVSVAESHPPDRTTTVWVSRLTGIVSAIFVILALLVWAGRQGHHYRLVLAFLVIAMFAAILHSYTFENGAQQ